jgi:hypothetical protein
MHPKRKAEAATAILLDRALFPVNSPLRRFDVADLVVGNILLQ